MSDHINTAIPFDFVRLYADAKRTVGGLQASKVVAFVAEWQIAMEELGLDDLGIEEFVSWSDQSRRAVYMHQAAFRAVFGVPTPADLPRDRWGIAA